MESLMRHKRFSRKGAKTQRKTLQDAEGLPLRLCAFARENLTYDPRASRTLSDY